MSSLLLLIRNITNGDFWHDNCTFSLSPSRSAIDTTQANRSELKFTFQMSTSAQLQPSPSPLVPAINLQYCTPNDMRYPEQQH
ncbi:hypothetical protein FRC00_009156 [Tulasnella sp. 408]|nr:hypothetical protein FRC00_009156 [Tulasnella sp. 408]